MELAIDPREMTGPSVNNSTVTFVDVETGEKACAIIHRVDGAVGLALSLESGGDMEVFMSEADARAVLQALIEALRVEQRWTETGAE